MGTPRDQRGRRGFTLMEVLIAVAVIAVLVAIAVPLFSSNLEKAREATCSANRRSLQSLLSVSYVDGEDPDEVWASQSGSFVCPDGGTLSWSRDPTTGVVTVWCSVHNPTDSDALASLSGVFSASSLKMDGTWYSKGSDGAKALLSSLTAAQRSRLDEISDNWTIRYDTAKKGVRIFFVAKDGTGETTGLYKYDSVRNQYQYSSTGSISSNGSVTGDGSNWGTGGTNNKQWSDTIQGASG